MVEVAGEADILTSGLRRERLLRVVTDGPDRDLVVNLARVSFIDSSGTGVLVGVWHRVLATDGTLALAAPSQQARAVLDVTGLDTVVPMFDTVAEAVQACDRTKAA